MSLAAMVLADRVERFMRFYDWWMRLISLGRDEIARSAVLRGVQPGDDLLDVGCGTGTLSISAARKGARVVGIDRSRRMLSLARAKAARAGATVDFREGQAPFFSLRQEAFDVATATFILSELSRSEATLAIRTMAEVVRPGGRVIIADEAVPRHPFLRLITDLQRTLFALIAFIVLQELAPTRRHPWRDLMEEAGLVFRRESYYQDGALTVAVAERPAVLPPLHREVEPIAAVLPNGIRRVILRVGAWLALPIAVPTGVYRLGAPNARAPVLLTGNFLASVEALRRALADISCYIIVEDTGGWNVWCASDARLFTAEKAAALIALSGIDRLVAQRVVIIPQLGRRISARLAELSQWEVVAGPLEARDIPEFLQKRELTPAMRSLDRMYRLTERLRVSALTMVQLPLWLLPLRLLPRSLRGPVWGFALVASLILPVFHYVLPGRTGIVKGGVLGLGAGLAMILRHPTRPAAALVVAVISPFIGWVYQSTSPVVYWKRIWR